MLGHHHYSFLGATVKGRGVTPMQLLSNFTLEHLVPREYVTSIFQSTIVVPAFFPRFSTTHSSVAVLTHEVTSQVLSKTPSIVVDVASQAREKEKKTPPVVAEPDLSNGNTGGSCIGDCSLEERRSACSVFIEASDPGIHTSHLSAVTKTYKRKLTRVTE